MQLEVYHTTVNSINAIPETFWAYVAGLFDASDVLR